MSAERPHRLFMLYVNSRPAAAVLCFDAGSHLYMYNSGYDPEFSDLAVGLVSKALCLQWAIENGKTGAGLPPRQRALQVRPRREGPGNLPASSVMTARAQ